MFPRVTSKKIGYWFGDYKTYMVYKKEYWNIFIKYNLNKKVKEMWSPSNNIVPSMTSEEYGYWYPFHMLIHEELESRVIRKSNEKNY